MFRKFKKVGRKTFSSLAVRNYRLYFIGQGISIPGTWMQTIAQTWLVFELTHSATAIGLLVAFQYLPILLFGPLGGVIADRFRKRRVLLFTQSIAGLLALSLGLLVSFHVVELWMVFALAAMLGLVTMVDNPTRQAFMMEMVGPDRVQNAVTLNSIEVNTGRVIGPTIAGILIARVGLSLCFFLNALSYVAVIICLISMHRTKPAAESKAKPVWAELQEGFRYIRRTPALRHILVMLALIGTFTYEFQVVLPVFASHTFHEGASLFAAFYIAMSVGSVLGGLFVASRRRLSNRAIISAASVFGVFTILTALSPSIYLAFTLLIGVGVGSIMFSSVANALLQLTSSPEMRGRVMSLWAVAFLGSTPIGGPIIGLLSDRFSPRVALVFGGGAAIAAAVYGAIVMRGKTQAETVVAAKS
jgi:MFS family permease